MLFVYIHVHIICLHGYEYIYRSKTVLFSPRRLGRHEIVRDIVLVYDVGRCGIKVVHAGTRKENDVNTQGGWNQYYNYYYNIFIR